MTDKDLKLLSPPQKKVACNVLEKLGFSYGQIADIVGVQRTTAFNYAKAPIPQELEQFGTELNNAFSDYEVILAAKAAARIDDTIARARLGEALEVYKVMRNKDKPTTVQQFNFGKVLTDERKEFEL